MEALSGGLGRESQKILPFKKKKENTFSVKHDPRDTMCETVSPFNLFLVHMSSIENYTNTLVAVGGPSYNSYCCEVLAFLYDCYCAGPILLPREMSCSIRTCVIFGSRVFFPRIKQGQTQAQCHRCRGNFEEISQSSQKNGPKILMDR